MKTETLSIDLLRLDCDTQSRIELNSDTVDDYADVIKASGKEWPFDPVIVFHDGSHYVVADGFHRTMAAINSGRSSLVCVVKRGTARDARIFGMTANDKHGLRMSRDDRRKNVVWLLDTYPTLPQADVATKAGVCLRTVSNVVADRKPKGTQVACDVPKTQGKQPQTASEKSNSKSTHDITAASREFQDEPDIDVPFDAPETPPSKPEKPPVSRDEQAKLNRTLAQSLIDKAVRAVDDLNAVKRNEPKRAAAVKALQGVVLW